MRTVDRAWGIASGLVAAACTLTNPAYEDDGGGPQSGGTAGTGVAADGTATAATTDRPGESTLDGGTLDGGTLEGGTLDGGETAGTLCRSDPECNDGFFCNGAEACAPDKPGADEHGCVSGNPDVCPAGTECVEQPVHCETICAEDSDLDDDGVDAANCGGEDCDDTNPNITVTGDWAHCGACGASCEPLEACQAGACVPARRVFVTSTTHTGALGGLSGADEACQALADSLFLGGTWWALLVDGSTGLDRLEPAAVPYVRLDGVVVANGWDQLAGNGGLLAPIDVDERRESHASGAELAWTGVTDAAAMRDSHCQSWSSTEGFGMVGSIDAVGAAWKAANFAHRCTSSFRLYCIEQDDDAGG